MAFINPSYNVHYANSAKHKMRGTHRPILNDNPGEDFAGLLSAACTCLLQPTQGAIYIAMSSSKLDTLQQAFRQAAGKGTLFIERDGVWRGWAGFVAVAYHQKEWTTLPVLYSTAG